jgi:hypothetical protein
MFFFQFWRGNYHIEVLLEVGSFHPAALYTTRIWVSGCLSKLFNKRTLCLVNT